MTASFYGTTGGFTAYCTARGITPAAGDAQAALVRSSVYIDGAYRNQFPGWRADGRSQAMEWPRAGATDREGLGIDGTIVPVEIESATYEGAIRELITPGSLNPDIKPGSGIIKRVKAGSVEVEYEANTATTATFQAIEQALGSLLVVESMYSGQASRA